MNKIYYNNVFASIPCDAQSLWTIIISIILQFPIKTMLILIAGICDLNIYPKQFILAYQLFVCTDNWCLILVQFYFNGKAKPCKALKSTSKYHWLTFLITWYSGLPHFLIYGSGHLWLSKISSMFISHFILLLFNKITK